jgi:hypothetical protein
MYYSKIKWPLFFFFFITVCPFTLAAQTTQPDPDEKQKIGFFKKIMLELFYQPPLKREIKTILKKKQTVERLEGLESFLNRMEKLESPEKARMLRETPCSYYTFLGLYWKYINPNSSKAHEYFSIALNIRKENIKLSEKDKHILEKISEWLKKFGIGGNSIAFKSPITGINLWVEKEVDRAQGVLLEEINRLKSESANLSNSIKQLNQQQLVRTIERDSLLELARNYKVTLSGFTMKNYEQAIKEINNFMEENKGVDLSNVVEQLPCGAVIRIKEDAASNPQSPVIDLSEFDLGKYCEYSIRDVARNIITTTLKLIQFQEKFEIVPEEYRSNVKIIVRLKGNADGNKIKRVNGISKLLYKGSPIPPTSYFSHNTQSKKEVSFVQNTPIYDDDLGFLRAFCAYQEIDLILKPFKEAQIQVEYLYESEVHEEKGEAFRGVEIDMQIHNLFNHLLDRIKNLNREIKILEDEINKKSVDLVKIDKELKKKNQELQEQEERIKRISDTINTNINQN